jgi:hypothetical protein
MAFRPASATTLRTKCGIVGADVRPNRKKRQEATASGARENRAHFGD